MNRVVRKESRTRTVREWNRETERKRETERDERNVKWTLAVIRQLSLLPLDKTFLCKFGSHPLFSICQSYWSVLYDLWPPGSLFLSTVFKGTACLKFCALYGEFPQLKDEKGRRQSISPSLPPRLPYFYKMPKKKRPFSRGQDCSTTITHPLTHTHDHKCARVTV